MKHTKEMVNLAHAGSLQYKKLLKKITADKACPFCVDFCQGKSPTYHPLPILIENKYWIATHNVRKYEGAVMQFLLVPKKHIEHIENLPKKYWLALQKTITKLIKMKKISWGALVVRFGNTNGTGGSVTHLHAQIIVGKKRTRNAQFLMVPVGYKK